MLSIEDIKKISFRKAGFGGYKPEDVDAFVDSVQVSYEEMLREKQNLILTVQKLEREIKKFHDEEDSIKDVLISLKGITDKSLSDAETKAKDVISEAAKKSEEMISTAKKEVDMHKEVSDKLKRESNKLRKHLEDIYNKHMEIIRQIPQSDFVKVSEDQTGVLNVAAGTSENSDDKNKPLEFGPDYVIAESEHYNKVFKE